MPKRVLALVLGFLMLLLAGAEGEAHVEGSGETFKLGDVVDLSMVDAGEASVLYSVYRDGTKIFSSDKPDTHLSVSYRPRTAGEYEIHADLTGAKGVTESLVYAFHVSEEPTDQTETVYSQRDGWWKDKAYKTSNLDAAGCAIFTLSHALHLMGVTGEATEPAALAKTYAACLVKGGTSNVRLIREASEAFDFQTKADLIENKTEIIRQFRDGAMFSFSIVLGHIAMASELSADGKMVLVYDSAPSVTLSRIKKGNMYTLSEAGKYIRIQDLSEVPGSRYYFESGEYGGLTYYLDFSYVAGRGVRLIKPYWLKLNENGESKEAEMVTFGTLQSTVTVGKTQKTVPTSSLVWRSQTETPMAAFIPGTKAVNLLDAEGKKAKSIPGRTVLPVLEVLEDKVQVRYDGTAGYLSKKNIDLIELSETSGQLGVLSLKGNTSGRAEIRIRYTPGGKVMDNMATGTPVAVLDEVDDDTYYVEVAGRRAYVQKEYVTLNNNP